MLFKKSMDKRWDYTPILLFVAIVVVFIFNVVFSDSLATKVRAAELHKPSALSDTTLTTGKFQVFFLMVQTPTSRFSAGFRRRR